MNYAVVFVLQPAICGGWVESATPLEAAGLVEAQSFASHWSRGGSGHHCGVQPTAGQKEPLSGDKTDVGLCTCIFDDIHVVSPYRLSYIFLSKRGKRLPHKVMQPSQNSGHSFQTPFPLLEKGDERVWPARLMIVMDIHVYYGMFVYTLDCYPWSGTDFS